MFLQETHELWTLSFFFVLEVHVCVAVGCRVARDGVRQALDVVRPVTLVAQPEVGTVSRDAYRRRQFLAVGDAER